MRMGQDWMWIGIGIAVLIGAGALVKPVYTAGSNVADLTNILSPSAWGSFIKGWGNPDKWWS